MIKFKSPFVVPVILIFQQVEIAMRIRFIGSIFTVNFFPLPGIIHPVKDLNGHPGQRRSRIAVCYKIILPVIHKSNRGIEKVLHSQHCPFH